MEVFYFIKYFENGFSRYFNKVKNCNAIFTFDLEDSINDFYDDNRSILLKDKYREILKKILYKNKNVLEKYPIAIRINSLSTDEFTKDLQFLKDHHEILWETILIPKTESVNQIKSIVLELKKKQVKFQNIAIFIETKNGLNALNKIISSNIPELKYVIFGHADYNLDNRNFPFIHQDERRYWNWIEKIANDLIDSNIVFINSPCLLLDDYELFNFNLKKLSNTFESRFGQMTLNLNQTLMCNSFKKNHFTSLKYSIKGCNKDRVDFAVELIQEHKRNKSDKSFSINNGKYNCPQEVVMANLFLDNYN